MNYKIVLKNAGNRLRNLYTRLLNSAAMKRASKPTASKSGGRNRQTAHPQTKSPSKAPSKTQATPPAAPNGHHRPAGPTNSPSNVLGLRIRDRRKALGLGLQDLAARTQLTASFISLVEREKTSPSLDSLIKIADALDVPFFHLTRTTPRLNTANPVVRRDDRVRLSFPQAGLNSELLVPNLRGRLEVVISTGLPRMGNLARATTADAEEVIHVLEGSLKVELALDLQPAPAILEAGDSIQFHLSTLQGIYVEGRRKAMWLTIVTPPVL